MLVILSVISILSPASVSYDASIGLLIWQSANKGANFNYLRQAVPENLSSDQDSFWAAHSPGQYFFPGLLARAGMPLGWALKSLEILCIFLGTAGYYVLYARTLHFSAQIASLACAVIVLQREVLYQFLSYSGGPLLLFAGLPYLLIAALYCLKRRRLYLLLLPVLFLIGSFLKLSFAIVAVSLIFWSLVTLWESRNALTRRSLLVNAFLDFAAFGVFWALLSWLYTSRGWTAVSVESSKPLAEITLVILYSLASVVSGLFSVFWSLAHLGSPFTAFIPETYQNVSAFWGIFLAAFAVVSIGVVWIVALRAPNPEYRRLLLVFTAVHVGTLSVLFLGGRLIAEDRHFWPAAVLLLPGVMSVISECSSRWRMACGIVVAAFLAYGATSYGVGLRRLIVAGKSQRLDLAFPGREQGLIDLIQGLDAEFATGRNVFFVTEPDLGLLVKRNALLMTTDAHRSLVTRHRGAVDRLVVVVHKDIVGDSGMVQVAAMFPEKSDWRRSVIGNYDVYYSGPQVPLDFLPQDLQR